MSPAVVAPAVLLGASVLVLLAPGPTPRGRRRVAGPMPVGRIVIGRFRGVLCVPATIVDRRRLARAHRRRVDVVLPEVIDLLALGVQAGLTVPDTLALTAPWMPDPFGPIVETTVRRVAAGAGFVESVEAAFPALGAPGRPLARMLVAAERDGAPLAPVLERAGDEARRRRRVAAEEAARRVPVLLLFPLVACVLPAFGLLTVVPVLVATIGGLELPAPP